VGKGTLVQRLIERDPRLWLSRSWTTRARRDGESPDAYHFATRDEFEAHVAAGGFLEWVRFLDYLQGSPLPDPPPDRDVVFEIDVQGAARVLEAYPWAVLVFVDAPTRADQAERLRGRGDSEDRIAQRLAKADDEVARATELPFVRVVNDDLERALAELEAIVATARAAAGTP
jgi:guanylate kinase